MCPMLSDSAKPDRFVSEPIMPRAGAFDAAAMARGEPGLPAEFTWRNQQYVVAKVLNTWKTSTAESGRLYLRRHWYRILTADGRIMTLYCQRQTQNPRNPKARWWLYSIAEKP